MSTPSSGASPQSARRRSVGGILASSGKLSVVGLIASVVTIGFVLWIQGAMRQQIDVGEPLARSTLLLDAALGQSFAELRGWVAYGDGDAKTRRTVIWKGRIAPELASLKAASSKGGSNLDAGEVAELERELQAIKYLQWSIEDVARTPADVVGESLYLRELRPIQVGLTRFFVQDPRRELAGGARGWEQLAVLGATDRAVLSLLRDTSPAGIAATLRAVEKTKQAANAYLAASTTRSDNAAAKEMLAFASRAEAISAMRAKESRAQSERIYHNELKPAQRSAELLLEKISARQYKLFKRQSRGLLRWSFLILALALLVGGLSLASIHVAYRLRDRVESALAKAKSVGQYVLEERIGGGGMGQVFRAKHALLRRPAAIKVLRTESTMDPQAQERFRREVQITSSLSHPNTIQVYDYGRTEEELFYYAMELVDGVTLADLVRVTGPLPAPRVVHLLRQICGSLSEAHARGLLHRDIKPSNIMVAEVAGLFDFVKVLDFGLVTHQQNPNKATEVVGTPAYIAPELIVGSVEASTQSEVYAIGAVAYFLVTGSQLFDYTDVAAVLDAQVNEEVVRPSRRLGAPVPVDLEAIIVACLEKNPDNRPPTVAALSALFEEADIAEWTKSERQTWWDQYGEAVRLEAVAAISVGSGSFDSRIEVGLSERTGG